MVGILVPFWDGLTFGGYVGFSCRECMLWLQISIPPPLPHSLHGKGLFFTGSRYMAHMYSHQPNIGSGRWMPRGWYMLISIPCNHQKPTRMDRFWYHQCPPFPQLRRPATMIKRRAVALVPAAMGVKIWYLSWTSMEGVLVRKASQRWPEDLQVQVMRYPDSRLMV